MASPFPGMDPYLEDPANWSDFHSTFINYWRETLLQFLPPNYTARIGERVYLVEGPPFSQRLTNPDVAVERQPGAGRPLPSTATATAMRRAPVTLPLLLADELSETYIEILHRPDRSLVAALELRSPSNKEEPGRSTYLAKRHALLQQNVHVVELDLLFGGRRLPLRVPLPAADYYAFVARADRRPDCDVYFWTLPEPLPSLPIPLRAPDADIYFDLKAVLELAYERGGYAREIDYSRPPANLPDDRKAWVAELLEAQSK